MDLLFVTAVKLKKHLTEGTSAVSVSQSRPALFATPTSASKLPVKPKIQPKSFSTPQTSGHSKQGELSVHVPTFHYVSLCRM